MNKGINNNGFDYVDLGFSSGTLWATKNVGALSPSESGLYFSWGDTIGYTVEQVGKGEGRKKFCWSDYKWNPSGDGQTFTKYKTTGATLDLEDDAAHAHMGGGWHMPSSTQIKELIGNTNYTFSISDDGVKGVMFTSKKDKSKFIFIPAVGNAWNDSIDDDGRYGYIWASMLDAYFDDYGKALCFTSRNAYIDGFDRSYGFPVRGVIG